MRVASAILFSCLLVWLQALAAVSPQNAPLAAACKCCQCSGHCCVKKGGAAAPAPAAQAWPAPAPRDCSAPPIASISSPERMPSFRPSSPPWLAFGPAAALPPYMRFCALLI